jgi:trimeric autotransporter adhesin
MSGSNNPPVLAPDIASVTEDGTLVATGNVLTNDSDPNGLTLSVTAVDGITLSGTTTTIVGSYGTLIIQPNGQYTYTLADTQANVRGLANGQVVPDVFTYTVSDGQTYTQTTTETTENLISQSESLNAAPWIPFSSGTEPVVTPNVAPGPNGGANTADQVALTAADSGLYYQTNVAGTYTFSIWVKLVSGSGSFALNYYQGSTNTSVTQEEIATGTWQQVSLTFTGDGNTFSNVAIIHDLSQSTSGAFEFWGAELNPGSTIDPYVATNGSPITTTVTVATPLVLSSTLTVDVTGNTPVAEPDTASVTEDETLTATGNVLGNDTDGPGKTLTVATVDGITISGTTTITGTYGTLVIQPNGQYTYTLADAQASVRGLANGQVVPDVFSYTVSDGETYGQTTTQTVTNVISQSQAFTASPWVAFSSGTKPALTADVAPGPNGGANTADQITLASANSGIYYQTNVAGTYTFSIWVKLISGSGSFALNYYQGSTNGSVTQTEVATGTWQQVSVTFTGDGNVNSNIALVHSGSQSTSGTFEIWGAQLNSGSTVEPYVPTSGSPVTTTITTTSPLTIGSTLTVDVTGNTPVTKPDTASVTENETLTATGNVLANDTDGPGKTLTVATVDGITISGTTTITGTYGTLVIQPNGQYTYTLANTQANVQALANGQVVPDVFSYTASDGETYGQTTTQTVTNVISQSQAFTASPWVAFSSGTQPALTANVAPGPNGGTNTADQITLTSANSGIYYQTNVAGTYTLSIWVKLISGSGSFALNYYKGSTNSSVTQTEVATGTWQQVSLTFTGDGNVNSNIALVHSGSQSTSGTFEIWGAQLNSGSTVEPYVPTSGSPVTTTITTTSPLTIGSTLTVDVTGNSDIPIAANDTANVTEDGNLVATGNVLANDTDPDGKTLTVATVNGVTISGTTTIVGTYGTLVIQPNGQYTYTLANAQANVRALDNGQLASDAFTYTVSNGETYSETTTQTIENLITASQAIGTAPWGAILPAGIPFSSPAIPNTITVTSDIGPGPNGGTSTADQITLIGPSVGLYYGTTVAGQNTFSVWVRLVSGNGDFSLAYYDGATNTYVDQTVVATATWQRVSITFTGDGSADSSVSIAHSSLQDVSGVFEVWGAQLNSGAAPETYLATSGSTATTTISTTTGLGATLSVNIEGVTPVAVPDTAAVTSGGTQVATGNVLANDTDADGTTLTVATVDGIAISGATTIVGVYGTLVIQPNGQYVYTLNSGQANVQELVSGLTETDGFSYTVSDGLSYTQVTPVVEENLITQSQNFAVSSVWVPFSSGTAPVVTANVGPGPNGGANTADNVTLTSAESGLFYQTAVSGEYTFSVWAKAVSGNANFSFSYYSAGVLTSYVQSVVATSTWQQFTFNFYGDDAPDSNIALLYDSTQSGAGTFEFWGAQLNPGTTADTYEATSGSPVAVTTSVTTPQTIGSTLTVSVSGSPSNQPGATLNLQNSTQSVIADLATDRWSNALTVLPLGDSITYGVVSQDYVTQNTLSDGFRQPLWSDFVANNMLINLVGDQNDGPVTFLDPANAAYPGLTTSEIAARLPALLANEQPGAILLMAGTNDANQGVAPSTIAADILGMLDTVAAMSPSTHVYVSTLIPLNNGNPSVIAPVNTAIESMVQKAETSGMNVSLINNSNFTTADLATDGVHPTTAGYALLAQNFYSAILAQQPASGGTPGGSAQTISSSIFNLVGGSGNDLLIGNSQPNLIYAGSGNDVLEGGGGNDTLVGGSGTDQFFITDVTGTVTIQDFAPSQNDYLVFSGIPGLTSSTQLTGSVVTQSGGQTTINLASFGVKEQVVLANYTGSLSQTLFQ